MQKWGNTQAQLVKIWFLYALVATRVDTVEFACIQSLFLCVSLTAWCLIHVDTECLGAQKQQCVPACWTFNTCWTSRLTLVSLSSSVLSGLCSNDCPEEVKVRNLSCGSSFLIKQSQVQYSTVWWNSFESVLATDRPGQVCLCLLLALMLTCVNLYLYSAVF